MKYFFLILFVLTVIGPLWITLTGQVDFKADYRTARRSSAHISPDPAAAHEAIIQAFTARAFSWRGVIASHGWISVKERGTDHYTVYQVVGWRVYGGLPALSVERDLPDRYWYNEKPQLILDLRGDEAEALIPKIAQAARSYPYARQYTLWPGPNSNTFPAYVARLIPELGLTLPSDAIGKDYLAGTTFFARAPSGTGYQFSLYGILGLLIARKEGVEFNFLGLVYGVKFSPFAILLPGIGQIPTGSHGRFKIL